MNKYSGVHQLGFVVSDMKKAMAEYSAIYGIKKWYRPANEPQGELYYKGERFSDPGYDMAIGYCGRTEIELITTGCEHDNIYNTFLREHGEGLHHVSFFVKDLDAWIDGYKKLGFEVTQNGTINGRLTKTRFAYMTKPGEGFGRIIEAGEVKLGKLPMGRGAFSFVIGNLTGDTKRILSEGKPEYAGR